jgi:hypothetical protein
MSSRSVVSILSVFLAGALCFPARADFPWMFAQVACVPKLGYFSIRKITIMNLPDYGPYLTDGLKPGAGVREALQHDQLIFDSDGLEREPFVCSIPEVDSTRAAFDVRVVGRLDRDTGEQSYCRIADHAEVILNGKSIGFVVLNPCKNSDETVSIEVAHDGVELAVRTCVNPLLDNVGGHQIVCSDSPFADVR